MQSDFQQRAEELYQAGVADGFRAGFVNTIKKALEEAALSAAEPAEVELPYICDACTSGDGGTCRCHPKPAPSVAAKALEWVEGQHLGVNYEAKTAFGIYRVFRMHKAEGWRWSFSSDVDSNAHTPNYPNGEAASADEAKSAAQADYEARIRLALSAPVQDVAGWQPIETAPKDGTPVILWTVWVGDEISPDPFSEVQIGYWDHGNDLPESHDFSRRPEWVVQRIGEPTHWMPLPAAPVK